MWQGVDVTTAASNLRKIIRIDETKCDGCGECIPNCPEGALQIIDGKARLVRETQCDGLGACLGHCPKGAITVEERTAAPYDEAQVMATIAPQGPAAVQAHLQHLTDHHETKYLQQAMNFLRDNPLALTPTHAPAHSPSPGHSGGGCPGSRSMSFTPTPATAPAAPETAATARASQLQHWPIQLHLLSPQAAHYAGSDLLLAADCVPFAVGDFHQNFLRGKTLAIACPKLDHDQEIYLQKLVGLIDQARINTLTVMIMQVPCCRGLLRLAQTAAAQAQRKIPIKLIVVSLQGAVLEDTWV
jgi:NAD-dependent dihydropyrimidine dehydrogenase PreA subunit